MNDRSGFIYGLQAVDWETGQPMSASLTKIGMTRRTVEERVSEMQSQLGAGGVHKLAVRFAVATEDVAVERVIHTYLKSKDLHLKAGSAVEWFKVTADDAEHIVRGFVEGRLKFDVEAVRQNERRSRRTSSGKEAGTPKSITVTPKRQAALDELTALANAGEQPVGVAGGKWGAAATALAAIEGIEKAEALVLLREMFL